MTDAGSSDTGTQAGRFRLQDALLVAVLIAVGVFVWRLQLRPALVVDATPLATIPNEIAGWHGVEIPLEDTVERMLRADYHVQRAYRNPAGGIVWLYVGYYGTERGGRSEHSPWVCYPSAGWSVLDQYTQVVRADGDRSVNEIVVERDGQQRLVHFWYRSHRSTGLVGRFDHALDRLIGRLSGGRGDGAFVRVSTPLRLEGPAEARLRLLGFGSTLDAQLAERWPQEIRNDTAQAPRATPKDASSSGQS